MEITIKSAKTFEERTNKGNVIVKQQAALDQGKDYPLVFDLVVGNAQEVNPYPEGKYDLDPGSLRVNQFGSLELDRFNVRLVAIKPELRKAG